MNLEKQTKELVKLLEKYQKELIEAETYIKEEKYKLQEMARDKNYILMLFDNVKHQIILHLICCYFWANKSYYKHWKNEIYGFLFELPKLKATKKYPTRKNLDSWFMEEIKENLDDRLEFYVQDAYEKESCNFKIPEYDINYLYSFIYEYFNWLCDNICDGKIVTVRNVSNKIDELMKKYK